jgi:hypothetical protein
MSHLSRTCLASLTLISSLGLSACTGEDGADGSLGVNSLVAFGTEPAGANCPAGGTRIDSGLDDNGDGMLGAGEIDATTYVCDGSSGTSSLIALTDIPLGATCAEGGTRVNHGIDDNGNGTLEAAEYDGFTVLCDGYVIDTTCAAIKARHPSTPEGVYTLELPRGNTLSFCDMAGATTTYPGLGFGQHGATYAGWTELASTDLQMAVKQRAFIALYNAQGGGAVNTGPGFNSNNCCFMAADSVNSEMLFFGTQYIYPALPAPGGSECAASYSGSLYRFTLTPDANAVLAPNPLPDNFFTTYPVTKANECDVDGNPAFFWGVL